MYDYFMREKVYQKFILGCENPQEALKKGLGGVIFFAKDIQSENQVKSQIKNYKEIASVPPFISIDQEGGRVERTEALYPKRLSAKFAYEKGCEFLKSQSEGISRELADLGFNLNFAPCVDVNTNPQNPIIGERAFSSTPDDVINGAKIFIESSRNNSIIPCIKHYPGHGDADSDSHLTLPKISLSMEKMDEQHIKPFKVLIENSIEMVMVAHLHCTCFDEEVIPTSLSKKAVTYLRKELGFEGVVITDDMNMKGVQTFGSLEACVMAIKAGVDMFIYRSSDETTLKLLDKLVDVVEKDDELIDMVNKSYERIIGLKKGRGLI